MLCQASPTSLELLSLPGHGLHAQLAAAATNPGPGRLRCLPSSSSLHVLPAMKLPAMRQSFLRGSLGPWHLELLQEALKVAEVELAASCIGTRAHLVKARSAEAFTAAQTVRQQAGVRLSSFASGEEAKQVV